MGTSTVQNKRTLTGSDLKVIACISMLLDHAGRILQLTGWPALLLCQIIGRLAFPIFVYLLVEGFLHTGNLRKYGSNLLIFALLSEIPYDLALKGSTGFLPEYTGQNTLFTLFLGLIMLCCIKKAETLLYSKISAYDLCMIARILLILLFGAAAQFLNLDYGFAGMACIGAMYIFRADPRQAAFFGCVGLNLDYLSNPGSFLSLLPLSLYDGSRGKQNKYFFYLFYPGHLILLLLLQHLIHAAGSISL